MTVPTFPACGITGKSKVRIANSSNGHSYTSMKRAEQYIHRGRACWKVPGKVIEFLSHFDLATQPSRYCYNDGPGMATLAQIEGLPVAGNAVRLLFTSRRPKPSG